MADTTPIRITVLGDGSKAQRALRSVTSELDNTERRIGVLGGSLTRIGAITAFAGLTSEVIQFTAALAPAAAALAALPAAAGIAGAAIGTLFVGFQGLGDAFKETSTGAGAVSTDTRGMQRAIESAARGITSAERDVVRAMREVEAAEQGVTDAERDVTDAMQVSKDAQEDLNRARDEAIRGLQDLEDQLAEAAQAQESADIARIDAQGRLNELLGSGVASEMQLRRARLAVAEAELRLKEATEANTDLQKEAQDRQKAGVDGDERVVDAKKKIADAARGEESANRSLMQAQQQLADAQQGVVDAQEQVVLAHQQLADAQEDLAKAGAKAAGGQDKQAEALAKLAPAARSTVQAILGLKDEWLGLTRAVQQALFANFDKEVVRLANVSLPTLRTGMVGVAGAFNTLALSSAKAVESPMFQGAMAQVFSATRVGLLQFNDAVGPLTEGLGRLAASGSNLVLQFSNWIAKGATSLGLFLQSDEGARKMSDAMDKAAVVLEHLWHIGLNVGIAIKNIFSQVDTGGFLSGLEKITGQFAAWTGSKEGAESIKKIFDGLSQVAQHVGDVLPRAFDILSGIFDVIDKMPGPVKSAGAEFAAWAIVLGPGLTALADFSVATKGVIGVGKDLAGVGKKSFDVLTGAAMRARVESAYLWTMYQVESLKAAAAMGVAKAQIIGHWIAMQVAAAASAARSAGAWLLSTGAAAATAVASMATAAASVVAGWVLMGVQSLLAAGRVALAWIIAMGPIALVIAAVIGVVALIIANWDTIARVTGELWAKVKVWTGAAWDWIKGAVAAAANWLVGIFLNWTIAGQVIKHWDSIKSATANAWNWIKGAVSGVVDWFASVPGSIGRAASGMWDGIKNSFRDVLNWIIDKWNTFHLSAKIPDNRYTQVLGIAGAGFDLDTPNIPRFARGGVAKGLAWVGEQGPELIHIGEPSRVYNRADSLALTRGPSPSFTANISIDARGSTMTEAQIRKIVDDAVERAQKEFVMELEAIG